MNQNKVNLSLTFTQRLGYSAHNHKMVYWSKENTFPTPPTKTKGQMCFIEGSTKPTFYESPVYFNNCGQNAPAYASITKECFQPTHFNEFAAEANLLTFKLGQNVCIKKSY